MAALLAGSFYGIGRTETVPVPHATLQALDDEVEKIRSTGCATAQCRAINSIAHAIEVTSDELATTQGITRPIPFNRDQIAAVAWRRLLRQPAANRVAICDTAAAIADRYRREGGDKFMAEVLIEVAVRMDVKSCFPSVLAALHPQGELRDDLGTLCRLWTPATSCPAFRN